MPHLRLITVSTVHISGRNATADTPLSLKLPSDPASAPRGETAQNCLAPAAPAMAPWPRWDLAQPAGELGAHEQEDKMGSEKNQRSWPPPEDARTRERRTAAKEMQVPVQEIRMQGRHAAGAGHEPGILTSSQCDCSSRGR